MVTLSSILRTMSELGSEAVYAKPLAENDNSKQQIYLGGSFDALSILPFGEVTADQTPKEPNFKARVRLSWLTANGAVQVAPHAQLILYPQYPEVRLSGFLRGCSEAPAAHLRPLAKHLRTRNNQPDGRVLFFGVTSRGIICFLAQKDRHWQMSSSRLRRAALGSASSCELTPRQRTRERYCWLHCPKSLGVGFTHHSVCEQAR